VTSIDRSWSTSVSKAASRSVARARWNPVKRTVQNRPTTSAGTRRKSSVPSKNGRPRRVRVIAEVSAAAELSAVSDRQFSGFSLPSSSSWCSA